MVEEKRIPAVLASEKFSLVTAGANMALAKCQLCANTNRSSEAHSAAKWAIGYYDIALNMIEQALMEIQSHEDPVDEDTGEFSGPISVK